MTTRLPSALALAAVLSLAACDSPTEPGEVAGNWALASIGEMTLPAVTMDDANGRAETLADTLRLKADGTGTRIGIQRYRGPNATAWNPTTRVERPVVFTLRDGRLEITSVCGPLELCAPGPHYTGSLGAGELRLRGGGGQPGGPAYLYRRAGR